MEETVDKRTKEYRDSVKPEVETSKEPGYYEKPQNNPGWKLCMYCGVMLPPSEDGTPKFYKHPTPCYPCVVRNK